MQTHSIRFHRMLSSKNLCCGLIFVQLSGNEKPVCTYLRRLKQKKRFVILLLLDFLWILIWPTSAETFENDKPRQKKKKTSPAAIKPRTKRSFMMIFCAWNRAKFQVFHGKIKWAIMENSDFKNENSVFSRKKTCRWILTKKLSLYKWLQKCQNLSTNCVFEEKNWIFFFFF